MLQRLHVKNFAIIDEIEIDVGAGLTILTGETGAGKSLLIDALGLILGDRADKSVVPETARQAEVTAVFEPQLTNSFQAWLDAQAIEESGELIIRRVIGRDGRSRALVNGAQVGLQALKTLGEELLEIHGQHAHQLLTRQPVQRDLLDRYGRHDKIAGATASAYRAWHTANADYESLLERTATRDSRLEFLRFQLAELETLAEPISELEALNTERDRLRHADKLMSGASEAANWVSEDDAANALSLLAKANQAVSALTDLAPELVEVEKLLAEAEASAQEAGFALSRFVDEAHADPARQQWVEDTLARVREIARKHRCDESDLPALFENLTAEATALDAAETELEALALARDEAAKSYHVAAKKLTQKRLTAAKKLAGAVSGAMQDLGMQGGVFDINIDTDRERFHAMGYDDVHFLVSANPGRAPQPVARVASGGELSRISLAVQVITADVTATPSMVFDEVDSGIGGGVAEIVGARLRELGKERQVLCVTHLPQVASQGHQHFQISKMTDGESSTHTRIRPLAGNARVDEVARMLGGVDITAKSRAHAREMLEGNEDLSKSA